MTLRRPGGDGGGAQRWCPAPLVRRLLSFGAVGASGFVLDLACYLGLQALGLDHRVARAIAFWPAVTWNWFLNRKVTFRERPGDRHAPQWARFVLGSMAGLAVNAGGYAALTTFLAWFDERRWLALVTGIAAGALVNFTLAARYVYRNRAPPVA